VTAWRKPELGIRAALGASRGVLVRMVVGGGSIPVLAGIVIGLGGAAGLTRFIRSMLFATDPLDMTTIVTVAVLLLSALTACVVPAWQASRVDGYWGATEQKTRLRIHATPSFRSDGLLNGRNSPR